MVNKISLILIKRWSGFRSEQFITTIFALSHNHTQWNISELITEKSISIIQNIYRHMHTCKFLKYMFTVRTHKNLSIWWSISTYQCYKNLSLYSIYYLYTHTTIYTTSPQCKNMNVSFYLNVSYLFNQI